MSLAASRRAVSDPVNLHERPTICIFDSAEGFDALAETISRIGYLAVQSTSGNYANFVPSRIGLSAAVISDGAENPLDRSAEMSAHCPVLFITSDVSVEARLAAARSGVDAILARPLDVSELAEWLNDLVGSHRETPLSILVVDDDDILAQTYALSLKTAGMHVLVEPDPAAALGQMTATYPDLVLMDLQMPHVSGIELAKMIRQSRRHLSLPIVFLSGERESERQLEARTLGGDDFICKPVDPERLVSLVRMRADRAIRLRSMMERDSLTGLLNHGRFIDRLDHELERCRRSGGELSLALIDVDSFKGVNDQYGHIRGDQVLRTLAQTLSAGLRRIDILGRYGGEEFGVLLLDTPPEAARAVIDKLRQRFSEIEFGGRNHIFNVTFSAGVSSSRMQSNAEELISMADEHMYRAKAGGRNRVLGDLRHCRHGI
jgi:diguanylate cyclase (GGDEF)-like protein